MGDETKKRLKDQATENARYAELEETRKELATGVEKLRADGGVSFIYDAPPTFEKWNDNIFMNGKKMPRGIDSSMKFYRQTLRLQPIFIIHSGSRLLALPFLVFVVANSDMWRMKKRALSITKI